MPLPTATLVPRRSRNPLSRQKVGWALVARNGRSIAVSGEKYANGGNCLAIAVKALGLPYTQGATEGDNSHYNVRFSKEWTTTERRQAAYNIEDAS